MEDFKTWFKNEWGTDIPVGSIDSKWFSDHGLPMVCRCANCEMSMILFSVYIDENGYTYCASCAGVD